MQAWILTFWDNRLKANRYIRLLAAAPKYNDPALSELMPDTHLMRLCTEARMLKNRKRPLNIEREVTL